MTAAARTPAPQPGAAVAMQADVNVRILRTMHRYLRHAVSEADAHAFLARLELDEGFLKDENNWVDYALYLRAWEAVEGLSGDAAIGFKVGRFNISRQNLGSMWPLLRAAGSLGGGTAAAYRLLPRLANQVSRSGQFAVESSDRRFVRLRWSQRDGYPFRRTQCDYRHGLLTAGPRLAGLPPAQVGEPECIGRGGTACVYELHFSPERAVAGVRIGAAVGLAGALALGVGGGGWLSGGLFAAAAVAVGWARDRSNRAAFTTETLSDQMEELMAAKQRLQADYDALRDAQQQLREKDRLASLGELSAKLAHELRNPLGIIKGSAQVIADEGKPPDVKREMTGFILDEVERMNASITNFLVFARAKTSHRTPTDVTAVVERLRLEWEARGRGGVEVRFQAEPDLPRALVDPHQLHQVLLNLLLNAAEAMGGAGSVRIRAARAGARLRLEVADDGPGFSAEAKTRAFEAFFTTKDYGTGLGLTNVKQMVEANGGEVNIATAAAGGAIVSLLLEAGKGTVPL